ncbi:MAG: S8/S53 family peptidase, partial [Planctomycetes bacterium]|nr:S8/S53 family peptidase [Planctomycetota bacterium]
ADVSEHPQGLDPFALAEALNAAAAAGGPLAAAMPDFLLEDDAVAGEHQTQRLRDGAGVNAPAQGYNAANGGYDDSGNTAVDARLLVAGVDELDRAWPAFVRRSHPAFRLAERVLAGGGAAPRPVVAVLDTGFGNGEVNPANPDVAGGGPNANPFLNDVPLARVGIAIPGGGGAVLRAANVTGGVYAAGDPYLQGDNAAFSSRLTDADPALTVRDDPVSLANDTRPHGTNVAIHAAGGGQFVLGGGGDLVDLLPVRHIYDTGVVMIGTEAERPTVWTCVAALLMAANIPEVDVVNASWGVIGDIPVRRLFYEIGLGPLRANGKILVVSAGNDRGRNLSGRVLGAFVPVRGSRHDPSTLNPLAMAVGATTLESAPTGPEVGATITNRGDRVSVTAPGDRLTGVDPYAGAPSYPFATGGTSFAAPQVAGLAALLIRVDENLRGVPAAGALIGRRLEVVEAIEATADDLGTLTPLAFPQVQRYLGDHPGDGPDDVFGFGRINSLKALLTVINGGLPREAPTVQRPGFDGDSNNDTDGDGRHDVFRSLRLRRPVDTAWYGFELRSDERRAQLELDGAPLTDVGAATPDAPTLLTYLGLEAQNFAGAGALKSRLPGLVPKGVDPDAQDRTLGGDYMCTFSLERAYFPFLTSFDDGDGDPATGRRLEITRSAGEKIWSLELLEPLLRRGLVPGVRFDDFVFEITTDRRANEHDHRVSYPAVAASRERVAIAWLDTDETAGPGGMQTIQARLLDANGYEVAAPFRVDQLPAVENAILASPPRLAMTDPADPDQSTFVVVWVQAVPQAATGELVFDLVARAFDAAGNPLGGQFEVDQAQGKKAMLGDCGPSGCFAAIYFKGHDIATRDGGYIVVWSDNRDNLQGEALGTVGVDEGNYNIAGRFLDPQGALAGNRFRLEPPGPDDSAKLLLWPAVAMGPNGGIVAFESDISTPASPALNRIDAVRLDRFGDALGLTLAVSPGAGVEAAVDVAAGPERLLVVWRDETQDTDFQGGPLRGRFFTLEGEPSGEAFRVNDPAGAGQHRIFFGSRPSADATADRFVVTWLSYEDRAGAVYYREYTPLGEPARYDLDYDGQADDLPADIQVDRVPPDAFLHVIDAPQVAARRRVSVRGLVEQRGGNDESFVFIWTDVRRSPQARDAYFVAWRPR